MNRKSVIIKSNKYGLTVILDDKMPFQELLLDIADKFQESANFFRNAKMAVTFRGRVLNREEERQVIETIVDHCGIHILCVVDEDAVSQEHYRRILNAALEEQKRIQQAQEQIAGLVVEATAKLVAAKQNADSDRELYNQFIAKTGEEID